MEKNKCFYITTAIPYVNANPHIGHALEFIQTDVIRRYYELLGFSTFLTTGSDENSLKNVQASQKEGISTQALCDKYSEKFRQTMKILNLSFDKFLKSSSKEHHIGSQKLWKLCEKDIYKKKYKGLYCVGCETFYTKNELTDGKCTEHKIKPELIEEENYFFRLSKYQKKLENLIEKNEIKIYPQEKKNEVLSFIKNGLEDFSISRSRKRAKNWGVPVPDDENQIMYVWFDALNIYQTSVGFGKDEKKYKKYWPADVHVIGKGIIRFHAIYWPAILLSAELKLPKSIFIHGYIKMNNEKISKSLGNVINPKSIIDKYGTDQLRYYLMREISPFDDGNFSENSLIERVNEELVSNYSNLFYRVTSFIEKNFESKIPYGKENKKISEIIKENFEKYKENFVNFKLNEALEVAILLSSKGNEYFQKQKPWVSVKTDIEKCTETLYNTLKILASVSSMLYPFIPESSEKALKNICAEKGIISDFIKGKIKPIMLFKKIELKNNSEKKLLKKTISIKEFQKLDLRVGTIIEIKNHPNADKLYILTVDLGNEKKQIVSGIRDFYKKEELKGKQITIIKNLEPAEIRGVKSEGMLLATGEQASVLSPLRKVKDGEKVT